MWFYSQSESTFKVKVISKWKYFQSKSTFNVKVEYGTYILPKYLNTIYSVKLIMDLYFRQLIK